MRLAVVLCAAAAFAQQPKVIQHMMLLEPSGTDLAVSETVILNAGAAGKLPVAAPADAAPKFTTRDSVGAPKPLEAKQTRPGVWEVSVPASQAETRVDINWTIPFISPETLSGRVLHGGGPVRMVIPSGVKAQSAQLESNGEEPTTKASIYTLKGTTYKIELEGAGTLRAAQPAAGAAGEAPQEEGPTIDQILPRVYDRKYWILGLTLALLSVGFLLNYRASVKS